MTALLSLFRAAPNAFWRHDVDINLSAAVAMARYAQVAGISSTFYLNPRSDFYNLFSRDGDYTINAILDCGHDIGLHCDYRDGHVPAIVERDLELLEAADVPTRKVSFHMPPKEVLWRDFLTFQSAYASKWKDRYLADSRGRELPRTPTDQDQCCLHPEWWF